MVKKDIQLISNHTFREDTVIMADDEEVMRFEITDQDLEDEMTSSYGRKRMSKNQVVCQFKSILD